MLKRLLFLLFCVPVFLNGANLPLKPSNYITDEANILSDDQEQQLNSKLKLFEDSTSSQIFVYVASSLNGRVMAEVCQELFRSWGIGQKNKDNGVLVAIFIDDHQFRIHTGNGMEGVLPDILTKHIQDQKMRPLFKENKYFEGIDAGITDLMYYSKHEFKPEDIGAAGAEDDTLGFIILYVINFILLMVLLFILFKKFKGTTTARTVFLIIGIIAALIPFIGLVGLFILSIAAYANGRSRTLSSQSQDYDNSNSNWGSSWSSSDSSSSDSSSSFDGGGGGDSGGGGSDSSW